MMKWVQEVVCLFRFEINKNGGGLVSSFLLSLSLLYNLLYRFGRCELKVLGELN